MSPRTIALIMLLIGIVVATQYNKKSAEPVICTDEMMTCPDGSTVSRNGPQCEFAPCPPSSISPAPVVRNGFVKGKVTLSPACGVLMDPPDPNCISAPFPTVVVISNATHVFNVQTDAQGVYSQLVPKGTYKIQAKSGETVPRCPDAETITVNANQIVTKDIDCESGRG